MSLTPKAEDFLSRSTETLNETTSTAFRNALPKPKSKGRHRSRRAWVYGFWMKCKYFRRQAEKYGLDWQNHPVAASFDIFDNLMAAARFHFGLRGVNYQGRMASILVFAEDDDRRRSKKIKCSTKDIDRIRKELGLPKVAKPRWFELDGKAYDPDAGPESEDEEFPDCPYEHPNFSSEDPYKVLADELTEMNEVDM